MIPEVPPVLDEIIFPVSFRSGDLSLFAYRQKERGKVKLTDESKPDLEMADQHH